MSNGAESRAITPEPSGRTAEYRGWSSETRQPLHRELHRDRVGRAYLRDGLRISLSVPSYQLNPTPKIAPPGLSGGVRMGNNRFAAGPGPALSGLVGHPPLNNRQLSRCWLDL